MKKKKCLCLFLVLILLLAVALPFNMAMAESNEQAKSNTATTFGTPAKVVIGQTTDKNEYFVDTSVFEGCKVGIQTGTLYVDSYKDYIKDGEPYYYSSLADAYTALCNGKIDVVLQDEPLIKYMASQKAEISSAKLDSPLYYVAEFASKTTKGEKYVSEINEYLGNSKTLIESLKKKWFEGKETDRVMEDYSNYPATNGTLRIATDSVFAPFEYIKDGKIVGYEVEIMALFCKAYGYKPEFISADVGGIITGVQMGTYDIGASCFFITDERKQSVNFTEPIYENYAGIAYDNSKYVTTSDFAGKRIGIQEGTTYVSLIDKFVENAQVTYYKNIADTFMALENGKVDAVLTDDVSVYGVKAEKENFDCLKIQSYQDDIGFALAKTTKGEKLLGEINAYIDKIEKDGTLENLKEKWIYGDYTKAEMEDYSNYPATNGTIVIATESTYAPMEFTRNGITIGYEFEIMGGFCKEYGYKMQVESCNFDGIIAGITSGNYDIGVSTFTITEERKQSVNFSSITYSSYPMLAYIKNNGESEGFFAGLISSFKKTFITENRWKDFVSGIDVTLKITVFSIVIGTILGFLIHLVCRRGNKIANIISRFCRWLIQGMPVVVFIMIMFYIIFGKVGVSGLFVAVVSFSLIFGCSMHNMLESAEKAIDPGQMIGATALGYGNWKAFTRVLLPQEIKYLIPSFLTEVSTHIKATAVVGYIAVVDLTKAGDLIRGRTYDAFFPLIAVAILYFISAGILRILVKIAGKKLDSQNRSERSILKGVKIK